MAVAQVNVIVPANVAPLVEMEEDAPVVAMAVPVVITFTVIVVGVAHCPASGVNVYVVVAVLLTAGLQVPVMLLVEVVGKVIVPPVQTSAICVKVGVTDVTPEPDAETLIADAPPPLTGIFPS